MVRILGESSVLVKMNFAKFLYSVGDSLAGQERKRCQTKLMLEIHHSTSRFNHETEIFSPTV